MYNYLYAYIIVHKSGNRTIINVQKVVRLLIQFVRLVNVHYNRTNPMCTVRVYILYA